MNTELAVDWDVLDALHRNQVLIEFKSYWKVIMPFIFLLPHQMISTTTQ